MKPLADAYLIVDLQNGVCKDFTDDTYLDQLITKINKRIAEYHQHKLPIIFIQHNDNKLVENTTAWQILPGLHTEFATHFIQKTHANAFLHTDLRKTLQKDHVRSLEICGAQTEYCVDTTIKFAHGMGYKLQMIPKSTLTIDNSYMTYQTSIEFYENIWNHRFLTFI